MLPPRPQEVYLVQPKASAFDSEPVSKNQPPALRGCELRCLEAALQSKHNYHALILQVMMQEANGSHVKWLLSYVLTMYTPSHSTNSHSPSALQGDSVGQSCNSHTFEHPFIPEVPTKDQITLLFTIHPHSASTLPSAGVATMQPALEQLYNSTAIPPHVFRCNLILIHFPQLLLASDSQTICTLLLLMDMNDLISFHNLFKQLWYSAGARVTNPKSPIAHNSSQNCIDSSRASFPSDVPILSEESVHDTPPRYGSKSILHVHQKSTASLLHKNQCPLLMKSCFEKKPPLDLRTEVKVVSSVCL